MSLKIEGLDELNKKLTETLKKMPEKRNNFLKQSAENLIRYTKEEIPVDTGALKNAWKKTNPYGGRIKVYNNTEYAAHVEWGHRIKKRNGEWAKDSSGKIKFVPGQKMLHKGVEEMKTNFVEDSNDILGEIFK